VGAMTRSPHGFSTGCGGWWERAHCRNVDPEVFFTESQRELALHHCLTHCEVLAECRREALKLRPSYVVQGGIPWTSTGNPWGWPVTPARRCGSCRPEGVVETSTASCGTQAGWDRHRAMKTPMCLPCRAAHARTRADRRQRRAAADAGREVVQRADCDSVSSGQDSPGVRVLLGEEN
jgi:hypothetical protein